MKLAVNEVLNKGFQTKWELISKYPYESQYM